MALLQLGSSSKFFKKLFPKKLAVKKNIPLIYLIFVFYAARQYDYKQQGYLH